MLKVKNVETRASGLFLLRKFDRIVLDKLGLSWAIPKLPVVIWVNVLFKSDQIG